MSIEAMTNVSYFLFAASAILIVAAVVLFFALDIVKCWQMVSRRHDKKGKDFHKSGERTIPSNHQQAKPVTEGGEATLALRTEMLGTEELALRTEMLGTEMLDAEELELIQDIVYVQDRENQGNSS